MAGSLPTDARAAAPADGAAGVETASVSSASAATPTPEGRIVPSVVGGAGQWKVTEPRPRGTGIDCPVGRSDGPAETAPGRVPDIDCTRAQWRLMASRASDQVRAILVAGPSGAGKTRLASRLGLPVLQLDDFYKDGDDPGLPRLPTGEVDWDHPDSWSAADAARAVRELCATGSVEAPVYDIARNGRVGARRVALDGASFFVAEGIFA